MRSGSLASNLQAPAGSHTSPAFSASADSKLPSLFRNKTVANIPYYTRQNMSTTTTAPNGAPLNPTRKPIPLSASQESQVRELYYKRVRNKCADEVRGRSIFREERRSKNQDMMADC